MVKFFFRCFSFWLLFGLASVIYMQIAGPNNFREWLNYILVIIANSVAGCAVAWRGIKAYKCQSRSTMPDDDAIRDRDSDLTAEKIDEFLCCGMNSEKLWLFTDCDVCQLEMCAVSSSFARFKCNFRWKWRGRRRESETKTSQLWLVKFRLFFVIFFLRFSVVMVIGLESAEQVPGGDMMKGKTSQGRKFYDKNFDELNCLEIWNIGSRIFSWRFKGKKRKFFEFFFLLIVEIKVEFK